MHENFLIKLIRKKSKTFLLFLLFCFYVVTCILLTEVILVFLKPAPIFYRIEITERDSKYTLSPNPKLVYVPKANVGEANIYGHRGAAYPFKKDQKKRIVFMGDSVVDGIWVPTQNRFTDILNDQLGEEYEVINLGVSGYNLVQTIEYFNELGIKFFPDYVFVGVCANDLEKISGELYQFDAAINKIRKNSFYKEYYTIKNKLERALLSFNIYRYIKLFFSSSSDDTFYNSFPQELNREEINGAIRQIKLLSEKYSFKVIFTFLPQLTSKNEREKIAYLESVVVTSNLDWLNLSNYSGDFDKESYKKSLLFDRWHFNTKGHQVVAGLLSDYIKNGGLE